MTPPVLVVAAALVDDLDAPTALLAARRRQPVSLAGRWEFPGGKVEPGEDPEAALHREIREELGVGLTLGTELPGPDDGCWRLSDRYVMRLWLAAVAEGEPEPLVEHDALLWLPRGEWLTVPWLDADVRIVSALAAATETGDRLPDPR
ncbi:(deoxy)nucleoside triphosphate pyrophosphohydrolase [Cellulomonas hominis]|uniref:8-oxo-dGTP diphosphatase n=1 Tax=Cellulomonas hominis TaxID=156981 RepID=A0A511FBG7_9CELL|nr:(deoxy)nucleoside triphosphate pyrophosphohydrolase [Cellulomonas hominis]MBB5472793.1 8-oxo-dGTP diphosphatase [Cellulomonas hominis]MBU5422248.1 (deoxy)nucleoside triphosphate pyrophosphohydrolase [Cellulomonas hominis]NKY06029.1 (deoxy)nucleoside triphosphate pyrophosphohydrolase [Cellulomonas hominis]GEL46565.1 DNA mismatch repair protein MutT [Cellulomonas hominis]